MTLAFTNGTGDTLGVSTFGGIMQIGFAFGFGIAFAIITCASTSGGYYHFSRHLAGLSMAKSSALHLLAGEHALRHDVDAY
ncbi:hypothetical protein LTS08_008140 [Lithohypha guttulata]|nr:hypothetical protein LTS08_008140 [Lithohypha guttulata]